MLLDIAHDFLDSSVELSVQHNRKPIVSLMSLKIIYFNPFFCPVFNSFRSIFMPNYGIFTNFVFCRC